MLRSRRLKGRGVVLACLGVFALACADAEGMIGSDETGGVEGFGDGDGDSGESGDATGTEGDGDGDPSGDGDGDPSGDGDGDPSGDGDGDPGFGPWCGPPPACDAAPPDPGAKVGWAHLDSNLIVLAGSPSHRVRDMFYVPGETQWLLAKFSYGIIDKDLKDELVDVYVLRGCEGDSDGDWELLGTAATTEDGAHPTVEGVEDSGGWVYFQVPADKQLELGRHRVHMVVKGDLSTTEGFIEVVEPGTPIFVSDVDGTLTTFETEEFVDLLLGVVSSANPFSAAALQILQDKGYHAMYLTARPEWLVQRTREFVEVRGYPPGIIHTTLNTTGALGDAAVGYKSDELAMLAGKGLIPVWVFGNTESDAGAYQNAGILPLDHRIFFQFTDVLGGRRIESYGDLIAEFDALPDLCR